MVFWKTAPAAIFLLEVQHPELQEQKAGLQLLKVQPRR